MKKSEIFFIIGILTILVLPLVLGSEWNATGNETFDVRNSKDISKYIREYRQPDVNRTSNTETICNGNICTQTIYSGIKFVEEDGIMKPIEEARSLKGKGFEVAYLEEDPDYYLTVVDFNYTSIEVELNPAGFSILPGSVPLRIWDERDRNSTKYDFKNTFHKRGQEDIGFNLFNQREKRVIPFNLNSILEFGPNSTTITIEGADVGILDDLQLEDDQVVGPEKWGGILKFNISEIPDTAAVISSYLRLNVTSQDTNSYTPTFFFHYSVNQSWDEETVTLTQIQDMFDNKEAEVRADQHIPDGVHGEHYHFDVTDIATISVNNGDENLTMFVDGNETVTNDPMSEIDTIYNGTIGDIWVGWGNGAWFYSKEAYSQEDGPVLNITYINYENNTLWGDDSDIVAYYSFDFLTVNDSLTDLTGNGWDMDFESEINQYGGTHIGSDGLYGDAAYINSDQDFWNMSSQSTFNIGSEENMSFSIWVNTTDSSADQYFFCEGNFGDNFPYWCISAGNDGSGKLRMEIRNPSGDSPASTGYTSDAVIANTANLQHIVVTKQDGDNWTIYVNGTYDTSFTFETSNTTLFNTFAINHYVRFTNEAGLQEAVIDEIGIWNRTLNQSDVTDLYNNSFGLSFGDEYEVTPAPAVSITVPSGNYSTNISTLDYYITEVGDGLDVCWYTFDDGVTNSSTQTCGTNWTDLTSNETDNTWTVYVNATDSQEGSASVSFYKDTIAPDFINITVPLNISYATNISELNYTVNDTLIDRCWYSFDDGVTNSTPQDPKTTSNWTDLSSVEGSNTWLVMCNDTLNNQNQTRVTFFKDTLPATITLTGPANGTYNKAGTWDLNYTYSESNPDVCWYSLDEGVTNSSTVSCGTNWTGISANEGSNNWTVYINDTSGLYNSSVGEFFIDTVDPILNIIYPVNATLYTVNVSDLNYTSNDTQTIDSCWYSTDFGVTNSSGQTCGTNWSDITSVEGQNNWTVWMNDTADNVATQTVIFTKDTIAPVVNITYPLNTTYSTTPDGFNFTYTEVNVDSCWWSNDTGVNNFTVSCASNVTTPAVEGYNQWFFWMNDTAGSEGVSNVTFYVNRSDFRAFTFNTDRYETQNANFTMNITYLDDLYSTIDAKLNYNGTEYSTTLDTDANGMAYFTRSLDIPEIGIDGNNVSFFWNVSFTNSTSTIYENSSNYYVNVSQINFTLCDDGPGNNISYVNFTFKDQDTDGDIDAEISSGTFDYWHLEGTGGVKKQLLYTSGTDNPSYAFCFEPQHLNVTMDISMLYRQLPGYVQRSYSVSDIEYSNVTTNKILYLTGTANGIYSSIVTQDTLGNPISSVDILVERYISGAWSVVGEDSTDDTGTATFYVDSDYNHRYTMTHTEYVTQILTIRPTQSVYTVQLTSISGDPANYNSSVEGITYWKTPSSGTFFTAGEVYNFTFDVTANLSNLVNYTFRLVTENDEILNQTSGSNAAGGNLTFTYNITSNLTYIYTKYYLDVGNGLFQIDPSIFPIADVYEGENSFIKIFKDYVTSETNIEDRFASLFWIFFIMFISVATFTKFTGAELTNPGIVIPIVLIITWMLSFAGYFTMNINPSPNALFINQYACAIMMTLLAAGFGVGVVNRT